MFFLAPFELEKNENTWSRQAKFVEVDPTQKIIFLSAYSSRFKYKKAYSDYSAFRPVKPQITIKLVTISCRYFYVFMASILLDMHDRNCVCFMFICIVYIVCNCNSRWLLALFFLSSTCKFSQCRCQRRLVIYQTWQGFHLTKFFAERLTITAIPKTGIIVVCFDAHCSEVTDLICSFVAPSSSITRANSTWFIMLHFKFLVSLLTVILKMSPLQRSEQKGKNEINPKDITQYQNMRYIFLHLVATESSICITSWKR